MTSADPQEAAGRIPRVVLAWGLAGRIPFLGLPVLALAAPELEGLADRALGFYAAVILSFLGGARWGLEIRSERPDPGVIALSMVPSVAAWVLIASPGLPINTLQLPALATALALSWLWDIRSERPPPWFARLRSLLTAGAVAGLAAGALS